MKKVRIADKLVGNGEPCFIVAEAGINHNGEVRLAKKLIDIAKDSGADAVKFQAFKAERLATKTAEIAEYQKGTAAEDTLYNMLKKLELTEDELVELANYARKKRIIFLASAFDVKSVDLLDRLRVPAFKIPSGEITNFPLLKHMARKRRPIILSTGMSTLAEVEEAIRVLKREGANDILLLHCVSDYPARVEDINLRAMKTLRQAFGLPVGFSDHTLGITIPIAAAALGAAVIEKHFTLDKSLPGPDQKASLEPSELKEMVVAIRSVEKALGSGIKKPTKSEQLIKKLVRRRIVARRPILKGAIISESMLEFKRSRIGIEPKYAAKILGRKAKRDIAPDEPITLEKVV